MSRNQVYVKIRQIAQNAQLWQGVIRHVVTPDEEYDLLRVSLRVYGDKRFWFAVQAAAGLDSPELPLEVGGTVVLPALEELRRIYAQYDEDFAIG